jgi:hypothetical protein
MSTTKTMNVRFQQKYDTSKNWEKSTIKLLAGEMAIESDTGKFKFGNGEDVYKDLDYAGIDQAQLDAIEDICYVVNSVDEMNALKNAKKGDIAVVKEEIAGGKYSNTAYMYSPNAEGKLVWMALDGNYSADTVYLKNDITLAGGFSSIGNYSKGHKLNAGTSLESILSGMLQQEINPGDTGYAIGLPSASISVSGSSEKIEVGNTFTLPTATLKIDSVGSYPFAPTATGITFAAENVTLSQGGNTAKNEAALGKDGSITLKATGSNTTYGDTAVSFEFTGTASYDASPVTPKSNLGKEVPGKKIAAGTCTVEKKTASFKGYRKWFYGGDTKTDFASDTIRSLTNSSAKVSSTSFELKASSYSGCSRIVIAIPANGGKVLKEVLLKSSSNADITGEFKKINTDAAPITVAGHNGYTPINYNVWEYKPASLDSTEVYTITIG